MSWTYIKHVHSNRLVQGQVPFQSARGKHLPSAPRTAIRAQAANATDLVLPEPLQSPFIYFNAFLSVATRRVGEAALDTAATVSMVVAEQPRQLQEFYDEVQAIVERDLRGSSQRLIAPRSSRSSSPQSSTAAGITDRPAPDLAAVVDELRADIAASRSLLQQLRITQELASR